MDQRLKVEETPQGIGIDKAFLDMTPKAQAIATKNWQMELH